MTVPLAPAPVEAVDTTKTKTVSFTHREDGTVFAEGRTFRNYRCFTRHFRDLRHVVLVPTSRARVGF